MSHLLRTSLIAISASALALIALVVQAPTGDNATSPVGVAAAQPKPKPACNIRDLPFTPGNEWVYKAVTLEGGPTAEQRNKRPTPRQPEEFRIVVVSVKTENKITTITLEESAKDLFKLTTKLTCVRDQLTVPPDSFFFMAEPGGGRLATLDNLEQPGPTYQLRAGRLIPGQKRSTYLKSKIVRTATEGTGAVMTGAKLDVERQAQIGGQRADITTQMGAFKTLQLRAELLGSVSVEAPNPGDKRNELPVPQGTISDLWIAPNIGVVQSRNRFAHTYHLIDAKIN